MKFILKTDRSNMKKILMPNRKYKQFNQLGPNPLSEGASNIYDERRQMQHMPQPRQV